MKKVSLKFISLVLIFSFILGSSNLAYCVDSTSSKATVVNTVGDGLRYYVVFEYRGTQYRSDEMGASFNNRMWGMLGEEDRKKVSSNYAFAPHYRMDQFGQAGSEAITSWSNDVSGWTAAGEAWRAAIGAREFPVLTEFYSSTGDNSMMVGSEHLDDVNMELRNLSAEAKMHSQYQTAFNLAQDISLEYEAGRVIFEKLVQLKADQIGNAFKAGSEVLIKDIIIDNILIPSITPSAAKASTIIADCIGFIKDSVLNIYDALQDDPTPGEILAAMQAIIDKLENTAEGIKTDIESKLASLAPLMETLREYEQEKNAEKSNLNLQETTALLSSGETTFAGSSESADYNRYSAHTEDTPEEYEIKRQAVIAEAENIKSSYESLINYILEEKSRIYLLLNFDDDGVLNRHPSMTEKYYNNLWVFDEVSAPDGALGITGRIPPKVNLILSAGTKEAILSDIPDIVIKWETSITKLEGYLSEVEEFIADEQIKTGFEKIEKRINGLYNLYWQYNGNASLTNYVYQNWAPEALQQHLQNMITNEGGDGYDDSSDYHILTYIEDLKSSIEKTLSDYKDEYPAFESEIRNAAAGYDSLHTNLQNSATYMAGAYNSKQNLYRDSPYIYFYNQEIQGEDVPKVDELAINIEIASAPDDEKVATINRIVDDLKELRKQELQYMTRIYNGRNNAIYDANKLDQLLSELQVLGNLTAYANLGAMIGKEITDSATYLDEDNTISRLYRGLTILNMSNIPEVLASLEGTSDAFFNAKLISDEIEDKETEFLSMSDDDFDEAFDNYKNQLDSAMVTSTSLNTTQLENAWNEYYRGYNKLVDLRSQRTGEYLVTSIQPVFYGTLTSALNITMDIDEQVRVEALLTPVSATNQNVTWTSSNTDVAMVDGNGWITALSEGIAKITIASADGNATEDCFVMVRSGGSNYLSVLSASGVSLSPAFIKTTLGYTGTVSNSVTSTTISAEPEDPAASIAGTGAKTLNVGANTYNIVATAQDGSIRTYTITITREGAPTDDSGSSEGPAATPAPDVTSSSADNKTTVATSVTGTTNSATASTSAALSTATASALLDKAKAAEINGQKAIVEIKVETTAVSNRAELTIPRTEFNAIAADTSADVKVETSLGIITFNAKAVDTISDAAAAGEIAIEIAKVDLSTLPQEVRSFVGDRPVFNFTVTAGGSAISEFGGGTAQISIPYTPKAGEDINSIVVWYIDGSGKLQNVRGAFNEKTGTVNFTTSHFSKYAVGYNKVKFNDVTDDAWYSGAVSFISARSITTGTGNGMFSPDATLTRGQFLVMLMRAYGITADSSPVNNFSDAGDTYYTGFLSAAKRLGITTGIGDNLFAPESSIMRQDMFTLLYRGLGVIGELPTVTTGRSLKDFSDAGEVSEYAKNAIDALIMSGIVLGSDGKIAPNETSNRAQMAQIIYRLLS